MIWGKIISIVGGKSLPWILAIATTAGGLGTYYFYIKPKIEKAAVTELLAEQRKDRIEELISQKEKSDDAVQKLQTDLSVIEAENSRYMKIFREHDLTELSYAKPGLIEKRINEGTDKVYSELERITNEN